MRAMPGTYSPNEKKIARQCVLVDYESGLNAGIALHGSLSAMDKYVSDMEVQGPEAYHAKSGSIAATRNHCTPSTAPSGHGSS